MTAMQLSASAIGPVSIRWRDFSLPQRALLLWLALNVVLGFSVLLVLKNFYLAPNGFRLMAGPCLAAGIVLSVGVHHLLFRTEQGEVQPIYRHLLASLGCGFLFGALPPMVAAPYFLNLIFGQPYNATFTIAAVRQTTAHEAAQGAGRCTHVDFQELKNYWLGDLCLPNERASQLMPGSTVPVHGIQSSFGIDVRLNP